MGMRNLRWPELRRIHARRTALAATSWLKYHRLSGRTGVRVVAVFDGKGIKLRGKAPGAIQVFYSAAGRTADDIVERLVAKYASEHDITVATSDLAEQQTALAFGAYTVTAESLRDILADARAELTRQLKARRKR